MGVPAELHIMQSNGGLMTARAAGEQSVRTMLSGPAAGVLGAVALARPGRLRRTSSVGRHGRHVASTSAWRYDGQLRFTKESEIGSLPVKVPMIDIHTLGAGGGSIAWIDAGGALRVGPAGRRRAAGPGLLRPRRHGGHGHRRERRPRAGSIRPTSSAARCALDADAARRAVEERDRRAARPRRRGGRRRDRPRHQRHDGPRHARACRSRRATTRASSRSSRSAAAARSTPPTSRASSACPSVLSRSCPASRRPWACSWPTSATTSAPPSAARSPRPTSPR